MRVLLETHTLLWFLTDEDKVGSRARQTLRLVSTEAYVSVASLWELAIKIGKGALKLDRSLQELVVVDLVESGFQLLPILPSHLDQVRALRQPTNGHADPFDRMLVAQALTENLEFLSADAKLDAYGVRRVG